MDNQPQQRFCTNCGQPLAPGAAYCVTCGTQVSALPGYSPRYAQAQDDPLLAGLAAGYIASRKGRNPLRRPRRSGSRLQGCGCLLLILAVLAGPFIGIALTSGRLHLIFTYVAGGMVLFFFLLLL